MKRGVLTTLLVVLAVIGGCWTCNTACTQLFPPPTAERKAQLEKTASELGKLERGDIVVMWYRQKQIPRMVLENNGGLHLRFFNLQTDSTFSTPGEIAGATALIIRKDDSRWPEYRDWFIFDKKPVTTQPEANPGF